ncbi:TIGR03943 family putative permease subunit [Nocardia stercoris]|uniref:TIGR03943 family protein n=1 Tax=Nocardia stercoris TaxID=2483361 RepID=A0A3M2L6Y7_9NOCA|nr:TIGR03943 family protein [Nocardia stercoris]RMI32303.1 TIGR03943 family protein [Nocardia stercoris]
MNRVAQNFVLLLIGGAICKIALDGTYLRYVKPGLHPYLVVSGVLLVLLALSAIGRDIRGRDAGSGHHTERPHWLLLAPIAALLIVVPPALGARSVQTGAAAQADIAKPAGDDGKFAFPPLPSGAAPTIRLYDLIDRAAYDSSGSLDTRDITVIGFIVHTAEDGTARLDGSHDGLDLARLVITCCVADAQTMRIHLGGNVPELSDDTWVQVRGRVVPGSARPDNQMTPTVNVVSLQQIPQPARVYG